jgi:DNA (cytosine-5)-methyltransferase 1
MTAYYNDIDKSACAWLRELIKQGLIADGVVDERSITDIKANDLRGFSQCHFFSGIGGWSYALRLANWSDDIPVWTASLPCQPFSVAGKQKGKDDDRHLLPHFLELVRQCVPDTIIGEQVEGAVKHLWLDDLHTAMEAENYTVGAAVLGAHSVNAPHQRQRLYWVASRLVSASSTRHGNTADSASSNGGATNSKCNGSQGRVSGRQDSQRETISGQTGLSESVDGSGLLEYERSSPNWSDIEWIYCRDGKHRPILTGLKPVLPTKSCVKSLGNGLPSGVGHSSNNSTPINPNETQEARVMRLRGYGNSIVPSVAAEFIKAFMAVQKTA